jgi:hypothetical protein
MGALSGQNGISVINHAILDDRVDVGSVLNVIDRIRIKNNEISEIAAFDFANMSSGLTTE